MGHWITVGGHPGRNRRGREVLHEDGFPVYVESQGGRLRATRVRLPANHPRGRVRANVLAVREFTRDLERMERQDTELARAEHRESEAARREEYRDLLRAVRHRGGIQPRRKGHPEHEEFAVVPIAMRRRYGLPLDEMAGELGYENEEELRAAIVRASESRKGGRTLEEHVARALSDLDNQEAYVATKAVVAILRDELKAARRARPGRRATHAGARAHGGAARRGARHRGGRQA
jgi:hypothetical protein